MLLSEKERTRSRFARMRATEGEDEEEEAQPINDDCEEEEEEESLQDKQQQQQVGCKKPKHVDRKKQVLCTPKKRHSAAEDVIVEDNSEDDDCNAKKRKKQKTNDKGSSVRKMLMGRDQGHSSPVLAQRICSALEEDILCMEEHARKGLLPPFTSFSMTEEDVMQHLVHEMRKDCPCMCSKENRESLIFKILCNLDS